MTHPDCHCGDHFYLAKGGVCTRCGFRLRCFCGVFAKVGDDWWNEHLEACPAAVVYDEED